MAVYGSNSPAVRFFRTEVPDDKTEKVLSELPPGSPMLGGLHPGGKDVPLPGRRRAGPKDLPWRSWLNKGKSTRKRKSKKHRFASLMG
jgi:hypothetical protein